MEYKTYVVAYKTGKGIILCSTNLSVVHEDKAYIVFHDHDDIMTIIPLEEIKTVTIANKDDTHAIMEVLGVKT